MENKNTSQDSKGQYNGFDTFAELLTYLKQCAKLEIKYHMKLTINKEN